MAKKGKNLNYKWEFDNVGGTTRVKIRSGADIAHLGELDPTMWTVLSCPVKGLEIDEKSMAYIDTDKDGKIRVNDVVATAKWATGALKNPDLLVGRAAWTSMSSTGRIRTDSHSGIPQGRFSGISERKGT